jgi:hypothetical protein
LHVGNAAIAGALIRRNGEFADGFIDPDEKLILPAIPGKLASIRARPELCRVIFWHPVEKKVSPRVIRQSGLILVAEPNGIHVQGTREDVALPARLRVKRRRNIDDSIDRVVSNIEKRENSRAFEQPYA